ncbi:mesoderm posterior protein 2-like [Perognathus longimembris pacificus]|uniref:mesoderm posterior protein 2-like n=1 Tax=Perognathus longimembris pacificus TaxID=214514 RepID=UPI002019FCFC|nr:mesoderm posterior protein 2-like [Perognathus longimembris pacificus]
MAQSPPPPPPPPRNLQGPDPWVFARGWGWAGHSDSTSPASSSDSSGSCPCDGARRSSQPGPPAAEAATAGPTAPRRPRTRVTGGGQRRSASEREKLRMRTLARALLRLRRFLPPSVAPAGQSLTKVETLRLAARYIGHLSAVLGLGGPGPQRRRRLLDAAGPHGCPLCPDPGPGPDGAAWGSPPAAPPESLGSPEPWATPPYCPGFQPSPPHPSPGAAPDVSLWTPPQACLASQASPEPGAAAAAVVAPWTPPPAPPELAEMYRNVSVSPESCLSLGSPPLLALPSCQRPQPQLQWGCWGPEAELLPGHRDQDPGPVFPLSMVNPGLSSGLRLSGCQELWHEDLEGTQLGIF